MNAGRTSEKIARSLPVLSCAVLLFWSGCGEKKPTSPASPPSLTPAAPTRPAAPVLTGTRPVGGYEKQLLPRWISPSATNSQFLLAWDPVDTALCNPVSFQITIPAGHKQFTAVIDDATTGRRMRNLVSMGDPATFGGNPSSGQPQTLTLTWNGMDEEGKPVPAGDYRVHGLSLPGLRATYDYSWYNPGSPPWEGYRTAEGIWSGWGGDHGSRTAVACPPASALSPWRAVLSSDVGEVGDSIFALNKDFKKVFGYKRGWMGSRCLAYGDGAIWFADAETQAVRRFAADGSGKLLKFQKPAGVVAEIKMDSTVDSIAVGPDYAAVLMDRHPKDPQKCPTPRLVYLDKTTGKIIATFDMEQTGHLAFTPKGQLFLSTQKGVFMVGSEGVRTPVSLAGLERPGALTFDPEGNLYVFDQGPDSQVKVYGPDFQPQRAIGVKGGQKGLAYDPGALRQVAGIAIDDQGFLWTVEPHHPRRETVWDREGRQVREFIGTTQYGACGMTHHEQDPRRSFAYGAFFEVDPTQTVHYRPVQYLNSGHKKPDHWLSKSVVTDGFKRPQFFRSDVSGQMREYLLECYSFPVLYVNKNGDYRPVAAIGRYENNTAFPAPNGNTKATFLWSDRNGDEEVQPEEMQKITDSQAILMWFYGWTHLITPRLEFFVGGKAIAPTGFTPEGAPLYDMSKARDLKTPESFVRVGDRLVGTHNAFPFVIGKYLFADLNGEVTATFPIPWTGVHGSMLAPVPTPGQTCGELFWSGTADGGRELGHLIASHGNMGQAFIFTSDGLFLSSLFKDARDKNTGPGEKEVRGADWTQMTMSQEPFGGWFGRQEDGRFRYMFGRNAATVVEVHGIEDARRFNAGILKMEKGPTK